MEEVSAAFLRANWLKFQSCTESANRSDLPVASWLSEPCKTRVCECPESDGVLICRKNSCAYSAESARVALDEGDKLSQVSTVGLSGISDDSEIGTLPSGEGALASNDFDQQNAGRIVVPRAVQHFSQRKHPILLGCDAFRSNRVQLALTHGPSNFDRDQGRPTQRDGLSSFKLQILSQVESEINKLEGKQSGLERKTSTPVSDHPVDGQAPGMHIPCYSRLVLLRVLLSSGAPTRARTKRLLQPPASHTPPEEFTEVFYDTKQRRGAVSDLEKSLRQRNGPKENTNVKAFHADKRFKEARLKVLDVVTPCGPKCVTCPLRSMHGSPLGNSPSKVGIRGSNNSTRAAATIAPSGVSSCLDSRSWITSLSAGVNWTKSLAQPGTAKTAAPPQQLVARKEICPSKPLQTDQYKGRSYTGKWKCPLMPSGVDPLPG